MTELRLILLVAGVLFIAGIAGFEWWRARRAAGGRCSPTGSRLAGGAPPTGRASLSEINMVREPRMPVTDSLPEIELREHFRIRHEPAIGSRLPMKWPWTPSAVAPTRRSSK